MPELANLIGRNLGSYRILSLLGSGGMGAVYLGEHKAIGHKAAIKILRPELASDEETAQRFFNEARAVNLVKHSSIVQIFDYGQEPGIGAYLVMEFLEGQSLGDRLRNGEAMEPPEAVGILCRVASALGAAHKRGLIHRDLKPDNIFLLRDDDKIAAQRVKVLDFGIAKLGDHKTSGVKTRTGLIVGTPMYMAPEYIHGGKTFDHRIDVYSLGIIAYEMLCGRTPFTGDGLGEMLVAHMMTPPPLMTEHRADVPPRLEVVILRALEKEPRDRYETMEVFAEALLVAVGEEPATAASHRNSLVADMDSLVGGMPSQQVALMSTMAANTPAPADIGAAASAARAATAARARPPTGTSPKPGTGAAARPASGVTTRSRPADVATAPTAHFDSGSRLPIPAGPPPAAGPSTGAAVASASAPVMSSGVLPAKPRTGPPSTMTVSAAELRPETLAPAPPKRGHAGKRIAIAIAAGAVLVLGAGATFVLILGGDGDEPGDVAASDDDPDEDRKTPRDTKRPADLSSSPATAARVTAVAVATAAPTAVPATAMLPKGVKSVRHAIDSLPDGATVLLGGIEVGRTPFKVVRAAGKKALKYELRLAGYKTGFTSLKGAKDDSDVVTLKPEKKASTAAVVAAVKTAEPAAPATAAPKPATAAPKPVTAAPKTATAAPKTAGPATPKEHELAD